MPPRPSSTLQINGRKRHAMVDTDGRGVMLQVHPASVQDRDGAIPLLRASRGLLPFIERVFADSAYAAERVANATNITSSRSSASRPVRSASPCTHDVGSSSASSPGSAAIVVWPRTSREPSPRQPLSFMRLPSCCSPGDSLVRFEIRVGL